MAKKNKPNPIQQRHRDQDIEREKLYLEEEIRFIFKRIYEDTFSAVPISIAKQRKLDGKLNALKIELEKFEKLLIDETIEKPLQKFQNKEQHPALKTARQLDAFLCQFFYQSSTDRKKKLIHDFRDQLRGAWFSRRVKTGVTGIIFGVAMFALTLGLILGTGGLSLMGIGAILGISLAIGVVVGGIAAFLGYKLFNNTNEGRGKSIIEKLLVLNNDVALHTFITERNNSMLRKPVHPLRIKYNLQPVPNSQAVASPVNDPSSKLSTPARLTKRFKEFFGGEDVYEDESEVKKVERKPATPTPTTTLPPVPRPQVVNVQSQVQQQQPIPPASHEPPPEQPSDIRSFLEM